MIGYPLWWLLGIAEFLPLASAVAMAVQLRKMRKIAVRRGFGLWALFLAWAAAGVLVLQVDAPDAVPGGSASRYFTFAYRYGWYLTATITLMYVYNTRGRLSTTRLLRAFSWLFVTVVGGGWLGALRPRLDFPSLLEVLLPARLRSVQFVHDAVHPVVAQLYTVDGVVNPRTSAPFPYTNDWGLCFACLLPFFCAAWFAADAGWRRKVGPLILAASVYPVIHSQDRGLWIALAAMVGVLALRAAVLRQGRRLVGLLMGAVLLTAALFTTPIGRHILDRLQHGASNSGRASLGQLSVDSVLAGSPIVGFGSTRNPITSFYSIAGGNTASCGLCTPPALGTQGHFWLVIYSTGVVGVALYLAFLLWQFVRALTLRSPLGMVGLLVITAHFATMIVYDSISIALVTIFAAVGLVWRASDRSPIGAAADRSPFAYVALLRREAAIVLLCVMAGVLGGFAFRAVRGVDTTATATVLLPPAHANVGGPQRQQSLDTIAAYVRSPDVLHAVSAALHRPVLPDDHQTVSITAAPNSRILLVHVTDRNPADAVKAASAAGRALVGARSSVLAATQAEMIQSLQAERDAVVAALRDLDDEAERHPAVGTRYESAEQTLLATEDQLAARLGDLAEARINGGSVVAGSTARHPRGLLVDSLCAGMMLGFAAGVLCAWARNARTPRLRSTATGRTLAGLPVLLRIPEGVHPEALAVDLLPRHTVQPTAVVAAGGRRSARRAAAALDASVVPRTCAEQRVLLVATAGTRLREVERARHRLEQAHATVQGVVVVDQKRRRREIRQSTESGIGLRLDIRG